MFVVLAVALHLFGAGGEEGVFAAAQHISHQRRLEQLGWVILGLQLQLLVHVRVQVTDRAGSGGVHSLKALAPVWSSLVPAHHTQSTPSRVSKVHSLEKIHVTHCLRL